MGREHTIDPQRFHHQWDNSLEPALRIEPGDTVHFDLLPTGERQVFADSTGDTVTFDFDTIYNLAGPVYVNGAEPEDTLDVEVLALEPGDWGWTAIIPGLGLLGEDFDRQYLKVFDLRGGERTELVPGVEVPIAPFLGVMGNHPAEAGPVSPFPPFRGGGNLDNRHLTVGSTVYLPVLCDGALFSCGDAHAAQGDGEVCVTGIESPMKASLRFGLRKERIEAPSFHVPGRLAPLSDSAGYHATMGIGPDLMEGARTAVRAMIVWLGAEHGLSREDAYVLCSLAGDLKILEIVDAGVWNVGMTLPLSVFV